MHRRHGSCSRKWGALGLLKCNLRMSSCLYLYFINLSALCMLLVVWALVCDTILGSIIMSDSRVASQAKFASHSDCWPSGTAPGLALKQSSWYSDTPWTSLWTGSGVVCPAQLLPRTLAILALVSYIMIQDSLGSVLKGARHSSPEEMICECNLNSHQVFVPCKNIAVEKVQT